MALRDVTQHLSAPILALSGDAAIYTPKGTTDQYDTRAAVRSTPDPEARPGRGPRGIQSPRQQHAGGATMVLLPVRRDGEADSSVGNRAGADGGITQPSSGDLVLMTPRAMGVGSGTVPSVKFVIGGKPKREAGSAFWVCEGTT